MTIMVSSISVCTAHFYDPIVHAERTHCRFVILSLENDFSFGFRNRLGKRPCYAIHIVSVAF